MYTLAVPVYNEERNIYKNTLIIYQNVKNLEKKLNTSISLLMVDDGSVDRTKDEIAKVLLEHPDIGYTRKNGPSRRENLIQCMIEEDSEYVGWIDSDLATDMKDLEQLFVCARYYDIVSGSRYLPSSQINRTLSRRLISFLLNSMTKILFGSKVRDHWCGFKMFKREVLVRLTQLTGIGNKQRKMFWDSQMWIYAQKMDLKILEIPVSWQEGEKSALRIYSEIPMLIFIFQFWLGRKWTKKQVQYSLRHNKIPMKKRSAV